jgi:hypothetical protein
VRCFGFGWDLVSAVAARFVGRGKKEEGRRKREELGNNGKCGNFLKS